MQPDAEVRLPAESAYVAVLRMAAAGIAARLDFTLDDVEDLRMAVSEACSMVLAEAREDGDLVASFYLGQARIEVHVSTDAQDPSGPDQDSFAWQVLTTTASDVTSDVAPNRLTIRLAVSSSTAGSPSRA